MDPGWLVIVALALGVGVGAGFVLLMHHAAGTGARAAEVVSPSVPEGIDQVLDVFESAGIVLDPSNNVVKVSPGALALGLIWNRTLVHPELVAIIDQVRETGDPVTRDIEVPRGLLGEVSLYLSVRVARLGTRYVILFAEDRTELNRLDEVRRDFVANISHELKTPIGAVSLLAEALQEAANDPAQVKKFAKRLTTESARLGRITQELIQLSRLQAADVLGSRQLVSVDEVIRQALDLNEVAAEVRRVDIAIGGTEGAEVYGDQPLLVIALQNLISNAIVYSAKGSRVGIGVRVVDGIVEIAVTDQGVGIAPADLNRVFERFFRVDQARSRHTGGAGLGLSIVRHTIENHGGEVLAWSQPGRGSTFTIRLPLAAEEIG